MRLELDDLTKRLPDREGMRGLGRDLVRGLRRYTAVGVTLLVLGGIVLASPAVQTPAEQQIGGGPSGTAGLLPEGAAASGAGQAAGGPAGAGPAPVVGTTAGGDGSLPDNCDPATGRIKFPSIYAPPCVHPVADNGGSTYRGVTATEIKVLIYVAQTNPALQAIVRAVGVADTAEDAADTYFTYADMFNSHYETYGRRVVLEPLYATGESDDDAAARRDAVTAASREPFLVIGGPPAFADGLTQRQIPVITQAQRPNEFFADRAPYLWGTQMSSTQVFLHLAEYIGKRLAGSNAVHAGSAELRNGERKFGLIHIDTAENVYRPGVRFFEQELAKYGVTLTDKIAYESDLDRAQEQARTFIARFKDRGVTSILFNGDFLLPIYLTQEATAQNYFPEWVLSGGSLVDTIFVGRNLYDQQQWRHAFGISQLWIRPPQAVTEPHYQHVWHSGRPPMAKTIYEILYQEMQLLFTGLHMAGPNLNPITFRDGLFSYPPSGVGAVTQLQRSWGNHGIWPFTDHTSFDSVTEVWWDPDAVGEAEEGSVGRGMYQFVDGGRRYTPGQWPAAPPRVFTREGARTSYGSLPESDRYPTYD